jgi:hypothetical protein
MNGKAGAKSQRSHHSPRFFLIEDQVLVRELLSRDLREIYPGCTITLAGSLEEIRSIEQKHATLSLSISPCPTAMLSSGCSDPFKRARTNGS